MTDDTPTTPIHSNSDSNSTPMAAPAPEPVRVPTHRCKVCGSTWKHYGVGASLIGTAKCMECDLEPIPPADVRDAALEEAAKYVEAQATVLRSADDTMVGTLAAKPWENCAAAIRAMKEKP